MLHNKQNKNVTIPNFRRLWHGSIFHSFLWVFPSRLVLMMVS